MIMDFSFTYMTKHNQNIKEQPPPPPTHLILGKKRPNKGESDHRSYENYLSSSDNKA